MRSNTPALLIALIAAVVSGSALADDDGGDNGLSPFYGDSWAALEAHTTAPVPSMQALQDRADAAAAWHDARVHAAATAHRWREEMGRMFQHDDQAPHA